MQYNYIVTIKTFNQLKLIKIMKPFNLKTYLENPSRKVITRDGRPVRIISTNAKLYSPGARRYHISCSCTY